MHSLKRVWKSTLCKYVVAVLAVACVVLIRQYALGPVLGQYATLLIFMPAVTIGAWYGGFGPGLLATILATVMGFLLFVEPLRGFYFDARNAVHATIFIISGVTISAICEALRQARSRSEMQRKLLREADRRKDEFLAMLAHELRNPLAPIRNAVQVFRTPGVTAAQSTWSLEVIDRQVRHMTRLIDDLLDFSRITHGTLELRIRSVELESVVQSAVEMIQSLITAKSHRLAVKLPPESVMLNVDPDRLVQILVNLLTNAAKYTEPGGEIILEAAVHGTTVVMSVRDNGIGMTSDTLSSAFDMFSQAKETKERFSGGLGVGLALTRGLVELHGGSIEARSAGPGQGSEVIVYLPHVLSIQQDHGTTRSSSEREEATEPLQRTPEAPPDAQSGCAAST